METTAEGVKQRRRIHPQKFMMWMAMGSMAMAFAGLTSGYMVREAQGNWRYFKLPVTFSISTVVILISSATMVMAVRAFKNRQMPRYKSLIGATLLLGILFGLLQFGGFYQLYHQAQEVRINGQVLLEKQTVQITGNPSESFLFIIAGLHLVHMLGGVIALLITYVRSQRRNVKTYNTTGIEIAASYWHFVDILWLYLFVFFLANQ